MIFDSDYIAVVLQMFTDVSNVLHRPRVFMNIMTVATAAVVV